MEYVTGQYLAGDPSPETYTNQRSTTEKEKVEIWFIKPLKGMKDDDAYAFLIICFPLLETIIREELEISDDKDADFSEDSKELDWFAKFMTIPRSEARLVWDAFRNGLLHRTMVKSSLSYKLTGAPNNRPATSADGVITLHVWNLRDRLVEKLSQHHRNLWNKDGNRFPKIYVNPSPIHHG